MTFGEKVRMLRTNAKLTQQELADLIGVTVRSVKSYELSGVLPRNREMYHKIAKVFDIDVNFLLTEGDIFILTAKEEYGSRGMKGATELVNHAKALFAGGDLSENDKKAVFDALQEAFFEAKLENKKYTPKKYLEDKE